MRLSMCVLGAAFALAPLAATAQAPSPVAASAAKPAFSTSETTIGDLLDTPATKAVLVKVLPDLVKNEQIEMARGMTLKAIQQYSPDMVSDQKLAELDAEFAKLPTKP